MNELFSSRISLSLRFRPIALTRDLKVLFDELRVLVLDDERTNLVTNVVRHTDSSGVMQAWDPKPDVPLRLEVEDHDSALPIVPDDPITGGRGLGDR